MEVTFPTIVKLTKSRTTKPRKIIVEEFIALDWCGWNQQQKRYTHMPSGNTLICHNKSEELEFLRKYPDLKVYYCNESYFSKRKYIGKTDEFCMTT